MDKEVNKYERNFEYLKYVILAYRIANIAGIIVFFNNEINISDSDELKKKRSENGY